MRETLRALSFCQPLLRVSYEVSLIAKAPHTARNTAKRGKNGTDITWPKRGQKNRLSFLDR